MRFNLKKQILIVGLYCCCLSCHQSLVVRAFYYWRTTFELSDTESESYKALRVNKLYLRFFDVIEGTNHKPIPDAPIIFKENPPFGPEVVPVVFIRNDVFKNNMASDIDTLARKVVALIQQIAFTKSIDYKEIQIDCDWTGRTKGKYFAFLTAVKNYSSNKVLSATIRLHQVKFKNKTGIPPVDRGMLMFYNMGSINLEDSLNSIFDAETAKQYSSFISKYNKPLDIVLPIFHWAVYGNKNKQVISVIESITKKEIEDTAHFICLKNNFYSVKTSFLLHGNYYTAKDILKFENITFKESCMAVDILKKEFKYLPGTVALFASDSTYLQKYTTDEMEKIYDSF